MVTQQTPIIDFDHFTFQYYSQAEPTLRDINLKIYAGEKILIVGPSGSGKSTLGHCLNGLIPFYYKGNLEGSLKIQGTETRELDIFKLSKIIGTVLQDSDGQFVGKLVLRMGHAAPVVESFENIRLTKEVPDDAAVTR